MEFYILHNKQLKVILANFLSQLKYNYHNIKSKSQYSPKIKIGIYTYLPERIKCAGGQQWILSNTLKQAHSLWMDGWMDGRADGEMDGEMDGWMDGLE